MLEDEKEDSFEENSVSPNHKAGNSSLPPGLKSLYTACHSLYPNQPNPLQVTALIKYWLGGPDPLDYISMYLNPGNEQFSIPPHWHYISFGLSDLHGDGRVHEFAGPGMPSGFGFELTMRVACEDGESAPPTWPAALMQGLAKYVFQSESSFCAGDHISWHAPLDGKESRIHHMLVADDSQFQVLSTPLGDVHFAQIVGVTSEELQAAQHWNGTGILNIMERFPETGGSWHITDMKRGESIFDHDPSVTQEVEEGIEMEGSNLSGVSAQIAWSTLPLQKDTSSAFSTEGIGHSLDETQNQELKDVLRKGLLQNSYRISPLEQHFMREEEEMFGSHHDDGADSINVNGLPSLHLSINFESGSLLPLVLRGRLKHGRHFTFKSLAGLSAVTLLTPSVAGSFVDSSCPFAIKGHWLQVLIEDDLLDNMICELEILNKADEITLPFIYDSPENKLRITIVDQL